MKITAKQIKLAKLVCKDKTRELLQTIHHDGKSSTVTNGHYLIVNKNTELDDASIVDPVLIKGDTVKAIKTDCTIEDAGKDKLLVIDGNGAMIPVDKTLGQYPNLKQVVPEKVNPVFAVDARYLKMICEYFIQCADRYDSPKITFSLADMPDPEKHGITMEASFNDCEVMSLLMPMKM